LTETCFDLVLLDLHMPGLSGLEVCQTLRRQRESGHLKIIVYSGNVTTEALTELFEAGVDDTIHKPCSLTELTARIGAALRLKAAQDRSALVQRQLMGSKQRLEEHLALRDSDLTKTRNALVLSQAKMASCRTGGDTTARMQRYCRALGEEAARMPCFAGRIDPEFIQMLESCVPLYDIGKIALPDHILKKPSRLDAEERFLMQTHTVIGADALRDVAKQHGAGLTFLQMAIDIARHHHERMDGQGYPDRLAGQQIPLSARLVAFADVYDGLRRRQVYKPGLSHEVTVQVMLDSRGQFDPALMQAFERCHAEFKKIFDEIVDG
jgi:putative two-component system response regulator